MEKRKVGRPINMKKVRRTKELLAKGLRYREIAAALDCDVKSVFRWSKYKN